MKGISPLIATVLLIGLTITIGLALSNWIIPVFRGQQEEISTRLEDGLTCSDSKIFFAKSSFSIKNATGINNKTTMSLTVENQGRVNTTDFKVYVTLNDSSFISFTTPNNYNLTLRPGEQVLLYNETSINTNQTNVTQASLVTGSLDRCPNTQWKVAFP